MGSEEGSTDGIFKIEIELYISYHYLKKSQAVFYSRWLAFLGKMLGFSPGAQIAIVTCGKRKNHPDLCVCVWCVC